MQSLRPRFSPVLDSQFRPAVLDNLRFVEEVEPVRMRVVIGLESAGGEVSRYETRVFPPDHPGFANNLPYIERILKFLLWQRGGHTVYFGGPAEIGDYLRQVYSPLGDRSFDYHFMSERVFERPFTVLTCDADEVPPERQSGKILGRNWDGCRIGFDLGASDRKVCAVIDGIPVYSEEVIWEPVKNSDPAYHYHEILTALKTAASKMPRVDAIGGSSAGIYIDNRPMVASLFRAIPLERYAEVKNMFARMGAELGVPLVVINDGDVAALEGSMSYSDNGVLGLALGSSLAAGYINLEGHITGWLNELAFAPVDYNPSAPLEEWSGDRGCGASYFSQQCVFRLASKAGIHIPDEAADADKLRFVQEKLERGHEGARQIWESMGVYLGYGIAHYASFYDIRHLLLLGRCTSGSGGEILLTWAQKILHSEFPHLAASIKIHLPDEKVRRIGQSVAAASLPVLSQVRS